MIDHFRTYRIQLPLDVLDDRKATKNNDNLPEQVLLHSEEIERLSILLSSLPGRERDLIALKYGVEMSNREISKITGLSESNVGTILNRTVNKLRSEMEIESDG